jgi:hypothetical protein
MIAMLVGCGDDGTPNDMNECAGKSDGTACGNAADSPCDHADSCQAGECVENIAPANTACGDTTESACDRADTCDGAGACQPNHVAAATACGDATDSECDHADTCDGAGACQPNIVAANTACGDATDSACDHADTCDGAGACQPNIVAADTACGDATTGECDLADTCDGAGACQPNHVAANTSCGSSTVTECDLADTCDGAGACAPNYVAAATSCGSATVTECDLADTCSGAGACQPNYVAANTACGSATVTDCTMADTCNGSGACSPNDQTAGTACYDCASGPGGCDVCSAAGTCPDGPVCTGAGTLQTTFATNNGHRGNMFDITAVTDVVIDSIDAHPEANTTIAIYYRTGTYAGFTTNPGAWTLIGSAAVTAQPSGTPTPVPVPINITIPAGSTYGFYVTSTNTTVNLHYTDGTAEGAVYAQNANLQVHEGIGLEYAFSTNQFSPRIWNGIVHYHQGTNTTVSTATGTYGGGTAYGVMFDLAATSNLSLHTPLQLELTAGTHTVDVYYRRGTFVGFEGSVAGWEKIGGAMSVTSPGDGTLTTIPLLDDVYMSAGETIGVYVDTGMMTAGLRTTTGGTVGDPAVAGTGFEVQVGRANAGMFGTAGSPAIVRGVFAYPVCGP